MTPFPHPDPSALDRPVGMAPFAERRRSVQRLNAYERACVRVAAAALAVEAVIVVGVWVS